MDAVQTQTPTRRTITISLRVKLMIVFFLLFTVIFAAVFYWFYNFAAARANDRLVDDLYQLVDAGLFRINGDDFEALVREGQPNAAGYSDDPRYIEHVNWLATIKNVDTRSGTYTMIRDPENPVAFPIVGSGNAVLDPEAASTPRFLDPDYAIVLDEASLHGEFAGFRELFDGTRDKWTFGPYEDQYGGHISGYGAIHNSSGEVVGVMGIDYNADYYYAVRRSVADAAIPAFIITYVVLFAAVWTISFVITRPIARLTRVAERIGMGDYNQDLTSMTGGFLHDEINKLADVFEFMVGKVREREEKLKAKVAELQIIVDTSKRDQQVSEIIDSDFFQDLQVKASTLRQRRTQSHIDYLATSEAQSNITSEAASPTASEDQSGS
jgi:HAMP domain-containing protein